MYVCMHEGLWRLRRVEEGERSREQQRMRATKRKVAQSGGPDK